MHCGFKILLIFLTDSKALRLRRTFAILGAYYFSFNLGNILLAHSIFVE